jgi:Cu+-exporting ATPase
VATAVLIIACPCALTLAAPIALGTAMGVLGRAGLFLKTPETALDLSRIHEVVFDKTGTLSLGSAVSNVVSQGFDDTEWRLIRHLAAESVHPISRAMAAGLSGTARVEGVIETAGHGIAGTVDGRRVRIGSAAFHGAIDLETTELTTFASVDGGPARPVQVRPAERPGIARAVAALGRAREVSLLSGDRESAGVISTWSGVFGARMQFGQSPSDKLDAIRQRQRDGRRVAMVGDGLNDAAALAAADVGIAVSDDTGVSCPRATRSCAATV